MDLTTREVAELIAQAVDDSIAWDRYEQQRVFTLRLGADAVLRTLHEHHVWLHRTVQDADGVIDGEAPTEVLPEVET